jgi:hypothetical protein
MQTSLIPSGLTIDTSERLVHGALMKCVDGRWSSDGRDYTGATMIALHTVRAVQHWRDGRPIETISEDHCELPDIKELNAAVPQDEWETGLDGKPRPPWRLQYATYLLDPSTASLYTHANSTFGAKRAWEHLHNAICCKRVLCRGQIVYPVVRLDSAPMFKKIRPAYEIATEWVNLDGGAPSTPVLPPKSAPAVGRSAAPAIAAPRPSAPPAAVPKPSAPPAAGPEPSHDDMNDDIPF